MERIGLSVGLIDGPVLLGVTKRVPFFACRLPIGWLLLGKKDPGLDGPINLIQLCQGWPDFSSLDMYS